MREKEERKKMYICERCRERFDEPEERNGPLGECFGRTYYEKEYFCPICGSPDWEEEEPDYDEDRRL